ncbi:Nucleotidylyl transferase [Zopfia rhizophila CBS 207.26]|uniref:arginine--tRNA ligase n=1 Tax=Zopfia rhizophila CBS 207.26 TaxID=1314779 RepID=A0A6A6DV17_9PEZI|nr:Nucleotidylyl transferase [Zopfia rhizophila CBS 207.26]
MATPSTSELEHSLEGLNLNTPIPDFASANVLNQPLDIFRSYFADILRTILDSDPAATYNAIQLSNNPIHGDLTVVLPRLHLSAKPAELAEDICQKYPTNTLFDLPWPDGFYLRVCIKPYTLPRIILPYIHDRRESYGNDSVPGLNDSSLSGGAQKAVIEFSCPNIARDFEGKHLRSTVLGAFVSNIYKKRGWQVTKVNYLGDWGKDIALLGVGWEKFGSEEEYEKDPVAHLLEVYHKIHELFHPEQVAYKNARDEAKKHGQDEVEATAEIEGKGLFAERNAFFKRMEDGDEQAVALSKRIRDVNIDNYSKFYARLGITFDEYTGESQVNQDIVAEIEQMLKDKGISEEGGGAWVIDMTKYGARAGHAIVRDRNGSTTYFLRYLAAVVERYRKQEFDKMIFVAADKTAHFSKLFKVIEALEMNELAGKLDHVQLSDVSRMAEKLGQGYQPHGILDQCENGALEALRTHEEKAKVIGDPEEVAREVGITALLAQEASTKRQAEHAFDMSTMTSFKSGTGPDLQYQHARLCSILKEHSRNAELPTDELGSLDEEKHTNLLLLLGQYPEIIQATHKNLEPSHFMTYLHGVVEHLSKCLDDEEGGKEVAEGEEEGKPEGEEPKEGEKITPAHAALYEASRIVLENGMRLLNLTPVATLQHDRVDTPVAE